MAMSPMHHLKQVVEVFAPLGKALHHAQHQPQVAFHHAFPCSCIPGVGLQEQLPLFAFGQNRKLRRVPYLVPPLLYIQTPPVCFEVHREYGRRGKPLCVEKITRPPGSRMSVQKPQYIGT